MGASADHNYTEFDKSDTQGLMAPTATAQPLTASSIHYRLEWKEPLRILVKPHNEARKLCWRTASDQLSSLGLQEHNQTHSHCTINRKHGTPGTASLLI